MVNKNRLIKLTQDLLRINSENPPGDERAVAAFVASFLKDAGLKPRRIRIFARRDNVLAVLKGRSAKAPVLITPHLDTVPAGKGWSKGPFSGSLEQGKVYGRGATDCKGNLAVAMEVMRSMAEDGQVPEHDVIFLATADEETGSQKGLVPILKRGMVRPAFAVVLDSDDFTIITAQKGLIHFSVEVFGRKAHGAYPDRGISAIDGAVALIGILKKMKFSYKPHALLKPPTINIGTIRGGDKVNMVADACVFEVDLRYLPGMEARAILREIRAAFDKASARYRIRIQDMQRPYEIAPTHPLVTGLKKAASGVVRHSRVKGSEGATVITFFQSLKIPAVATGYGAKGCAHATDEYVRVHDLYRGAIILERFLKSFSS